MRQLTAYASYHDNLGELLIGRARFCNLDGSPAQVYGLDNARQQFISLGTTVYTNSSGQLTPQVFLDNHDYLIFFDKYIGDGTMAEDDDEESWEEQGSAVDRYNTLGVELIGITTRTISTIADLHTSEPLDDGEIVLLLGYNTPGDKPPIYYKWDAVSTAQDNGGSVIKVTGQERGRWVLPECPASLDVRHFGAFPISDSVADAAQRYAVQRAGFYAHENSCGIYFPANDTAIYYDISGLTLYDVDCNPAARVFAVDDTNATINGIEKIYCGGSTLGRIELINREVRSSWEGDYRMVTFSPTEKLIIDSQLYPLPRTWTGVQVEMRVYCGPNMVFDDCIITSNGAITGAITIKNCELKTEWFSDDYNWSDLISVGNTILLDNCKDANTYILLKNKQNENDYGDLGEQTLSSVTLLAGCIVENASFQNVTIQGAVELHNVSGTIVVSGSSLELNAVDCWLTTDGDVVVTRIQMRRGNLSGTGRLQILQDSLFVDVDLNKQLMSLGTLLTIERSRIYGYITAQNIVLHYNEIYNEINQTDNSGLITIDCIGNVFNIIPNTSVPARHYVHAATPNSVVKGTWQGNSSSYDSVHWIRLDRTNLKPRDIDHDYCYVGNNEPYLSKWNGLHTHMSLLCYRGNKSTGRDIFRTTTVGFIFFNTSTHMISIVNRTGHWRMFTVGSTACTRVCRIIPGTVDGEGYSEAGDANRRFTPILWMWGQSYTYLGATCLDALGEATYKWSFEAADTDHNPDTAPGGIFSNGRDVGCFTMEPTGAADSHWPIYGDSTATQRTMNIYVEVAPDFRSRYTQS